MRFALLGEHPDGLDMARALVESGCYELGWVSCSSQGIEALRRRGLTARNVGDIEEILADPAIEAVVVAGNLTLRAAQLRRALQSERHVLCVHPLDTSPDSAYEAAMIQADTRRVLLPLLTEGIHPGVERLAQLLHDEKSSLGRARLIEIERWGSPGSIWLEMDMEPFEPTFSGWDVLRNLQGEIAEVFAYTGAEEIAVESVVVLGGRFENGGMFRATYIPGGPEVRWRVAVIGSRGQAELLFPSGWPGIGILRWEDETGSFKEERWDDWNPWPILAEKFAKTIADWSNHFAGLEKPTCQQNASWQDAIRSLELDDAARRSVKRRRASTLEYPEATEEVGFKGTMTLVGCGMLWIMLILVIFANWFPKLKFVVIPMLVLFLVLQFLRWVVLRQPAKPSPKR